MEITNTLIDNSKKLKLACYLNDLLTDERYSEICIASGYWDLPGTKLIFDNLQKFLSKGGVLRLLIGEEPMVREYQMSPTQIEKARKFPDSYMKVQIDNLSTEYQPIIEMLLDYCRETENSQIQIRIFGQNLTPKQFLHAKCYIFKGAGVSKGIIGSANFTAKGLAENAELCYIETDSSKVSAEPGAYSSSKGHICWFDEKWENSIAWNQTFRQDILIPSPLAKKIQAETPSFKITPYSVYVKFLQEQFGDIQTSPSLPLSYKIKNYRFQSNAVDYGYRIMKNHNGFLLADVVGLGKTMVALMVAAKFLNDPDTAGREKDILIVTPPAVKRAWEDAIKLFDVDSDGRLSSHIDIITTGKVAGMVQTNFDDDEAEDLEDGEAEELNFKQTTKQYGMVIVDESHKFRNASTQMYKTLDDLIGGIYPQSPYVILLSATPQNNYPCDLANQIYLFQRESQNTTLDTIKGRRLDSFFNAKQKEFMIAKVNKDYAAIKDISAEIRVKVLDSILVRRTRTDVRKFYPAEAEKLNFPTIRGPKLLHYHLDKELAQLFSDTMDIIAPFDKGKGEITFKDNGLFYYRYRAIEYLTEPEAKKLYFIRNLTPESTSRRLARIMQMLLVKRLESSIIAFKTSLKNLRRYTQNMVDMIKADCVFICPDIDVNSELNIQEKRTKRPSITRKDCYDDIRRIIKKKGGNNREYKAGALDPKYLELLEDELLKIDILCNRWEAVSYDPKLEVFKKSLKAELFLPEINNPHGYDKPRLVIFTEAIDTLRQLSSHIEHAGHNVLSITAANRKDKENVIRANFDANAEDEDKRDDFDVIVTTEVLAEGINLHRSNVILNYDTPWNSTRLMQRIGRVNRIGSKEDFVHVYNFMPTAEGDKEIELVNKAHSKLQAFHSLFGEDSKIFTQQEEVTTFGIDPKMIQSAIDGEESPLEKYAAELRQFQASHPDEYDWIARQPMPLVSAKSASADGFACVVRNDQRKQGLKLHLRDDKFSDISLMAMLELLQCSYDTPAVEVNRKQIKSNLERALLEYTAFFQRMMTASDSNKLRDNAVGCIVKLRKSDRLTDDTKALLATARKFIDKHDRPLARKIICLYEKLCEENVLLPMNDDELNDILRHELIGVTIKQSQKTGVASPEVTLAMTNYEGQDE